MKRKETYHFLLEEASTPIYQRIIRSLESTFHELGNHRVSTINIRLFKGFQDYINFIEREQVDYCIVINPSGALSEFIEEHNAFLFELVKATIIFIHYDNLFSDLTNIKIIKGKLESFHRLKDKSFHFCIEYQNFLDLRNIGIENTYLIRHASEFKPFSADPEYMYKFSFLGHVLPGFKYQELDDIPISHYLFADFWNRLISLDTKLEPSSMRFAENMLGSSQVDIEFLSHKYFYLALLHLQSQFFRGELISRLNHTIDIFGGDPAYLSELGFNRTIQKDTVIYHPSINNYSDSRSIYAYSKVNLNITPLQFDYAVINRVIDVAAVGGFILTDWKPDLQALTSVSQEISYRTIEELNFKCEYYLHPEHAKERAEIADALHKDVMDKCTYQMIVEDILNRISSNLESSTNEMETVKIDLGCGSWKPEGFIGVDVSPGSNVDVVADLNQRFPFPDNSVDFIRAHDAVEHLTSPIHTMNEIWRIGRAGALVDIRVPSTDGRGAFQDPTHISFWNINSFKYYCKNFPAYIRLCRSYGFKGLFELIHLSEKFSEENVVHVNALLKVVKPADLDNIIEESSNVPQIILREINLITFPDWHQDEETLLKELADLFQAFMCHPKRQEITLSLCVRDITIDEANLLLAGVVMYLATERNIEIEDETLAINLLNQPNDQELQYLASRAKAQIKLNDHDFETNQYQYLQSLPVITLDAINNL